MLHFALPPTVNHLGINKYPFIVTVLAKSFDLVAINGKAMVEVPAQDKPADAVQIAIMGFDVTQPGAQVIGAGGINRARC